jgi:hypothetical protein
MYWDSALEIKINREIGESLSFHRYVKHGYPLTPHLFILTIDVLGHMLEDPKFGVEGLALSKGEMLRPNLYG